MSPPAPPRPLRDLPPPPGITRVEGGVELCVYAGHADTVHVCLFDAGDREGASERRIPLTERAHGFWFGHLRGVTPGQRYAVRASGPWQPENGLRYNESKLLLDPYARAIEGDVRLAPSVFGHQVGVELAGDTGLRDDRDSKAYVPRCVVVDEAFDWEGDVSPHRSLAETVIYEVHVKNLTQRLPGHPRPPPRHLRGTGPPRHHRAPHPARRHRRRAAARAGVHHRARSAPARPDEPLGLQHAGVLRPARGVCVGPGPAGRARRVQGHGQAAAPGRHRGPPRRRLQPHERAERDGDDAELARPGQPRLLPARRPRPRHRRHRLRQHPRPAPPGGVPDGAGLAALLGRGVPRRRVPVRPRRRPGPRALRRLRPQPPLPRRPAHRPGPLPRQEHRRAVGPRDPRLAHRSVPAAVQRVERPLPRRRPVVLAGRPRPRPRVATRATASRTSPPGWPGRRTSSAPATAGRSRRSTSSPPTTGSPLATSRRTTSSTTRPTSRATATAPTTTCRGTTASRARPTTRTSRRPGGGRSATCSARC